MTFPKDFIWGAACASYQCEGAWNEDDKAPSIWDDFCHDTQRHNIKDGDTGDVACDSYHRYAEDIALMREMGVKTYRFSINWPRVFPQGRGEVNEAGFAYYVKLVDELLKNGIEPMVTLYHWELPSALQKDGGWLNRDTVTAFGEMAAECARRFDGKVTKYVTINEPQCAVWLGHEKCEHAPGIKLGITEQAKIMHHLILAHNAATKALRKNSSVPLEIGAATCGDLFYPEADTEKCRQAAYNASFSLKECWSFRHSSFLDSIFFKKFGDDAPEAVKAFEKTIPQSDWDDMEIPDFIGVNVYSGIMVGEDGVPVKKPSGFPLTAIKWPITPEVMHYGMVNLYKRYGKPIMITENGLSCNDKVYLDGKVHDADRIDFLNRYLRELKLAVDEGVPVMGYLQWSILDNFEWGEGYNERFGLIYINYQTLERIPKDSAKWYADVIRTNGAIL